MLLMVVILPDKVVKTEWDMARGGAHAIACVEAVVDFIPMNRWLKRVNLLDRVAFMSLPRSRGRSPRTSHEEGSREPLQFYLQIRDEEHLAMLVIPPKFMEVMKEWLTVKIVRVVKLSVKKVVRVLGASPELRGAYGAWRGLVLLLPPPQDHPRRPRYDAHLWLRPQGSNLQP
ncbi:Protein transport protein Sec31A [Hordeum vulgare]|nr:Protein transport protein Sec31A [Hordeum vulgare]